MDAIEKVCSETCSRLNEIGAFVSSKGVKSFPRWLFDIEECGGKLAKALKSGSIALGYSGRLKEEVAELRPLRQALFRLSGICSVGGFGLPPQAVCKVISSAAEDLGKQILLSTEVRD